VPVSSEEQSIDVTRMQIRQLELVDRVLGLEAQVARLTAAGAESWPRIEVDRLRGELAAVYGSRTWRVGTTVLKPLRAISSLRAKSPR
jgi:hypothetical protein